MNRTQQQTNQVENISTIGRVIRFSVGAAMMTPVFFVSGPIGSFALLALLAILPVVCAIDGFCPLTAWYDTRRQRHSTESNTSMSKVQRSSYASLAIALIGSVFVLPIQPLGALAVLPLIGIYPAIVALFGVELFTESLTATKSTQPEFTRGQVASVTRVTQQPQRQNNVAHAA